MRLDALAGLLLCPVCRRDWASASGCCRRCRAGLFHPIRLPALIALGYYRGALRRAIHAYKFRGARRLAAPFAEALASEVVERGWQPQAVSFVPLHRQRSRARGYDQARLLAAGVAEHLGLACRGTIVRVRATYPQSRLAAWERRANVASAFRVADRPPATLLLIDDVLTTGATLAACRAALESAGSRRVLLAVLALAPPPGRRSPAS